MTPLVLAHKYMDSFYRKEPLENMADLLSENLVFEGPFYSFNSADEYLESLKEDPPREVGCEVINQYQDTKSACIIYQFSKSGRRVLMAQYFEVEK